MRMFYYKTMNTKNNIIVRLSVPPVDPSTVPLRPCTAFEYDRSAYQETFTTQWDLVCDRKYLKSMSQSGRSGKIAIIILILTLT